MRNFATIATILTLAACTDAEPYCDQEHIFELYEDLLDETVPVTVHTYAPTPTEQATIEDHLTNLNDATAPLTFELREQQKHYWGCDTEPHSYNAAAFNIYYCPTISEEQVIAGYAQPGAFTPIIGYANQQQYQQTIARSLDVICDDCTTFTDEQLTRMRCTISEEATILYPLSMFF